MLSTQRVAEHASQRRFTSNQRSRAFSATHLTDETSQLGIGRTGNRVAVKRCLAKMRMRAAAAAFDAWTEMVEERKRNRVAVARCLAKMQQRTVRAAFASMLDLVERRQFARSFLGNPDPSDDASIIREQAQHQNVWLETPLVRTSNPQNGVCVLVHSPPLISVD